MEQQVKEQRAAATQPRKRPRPPMCGPDPSGQGSGRGGEDEKGALSKAEEVAKERARKEAATEWRASS